MFILKVASMMDKCILNFRVSDEGDLNSMQYWSENHYATWNAAAYLIGSTQLQ